MIALHDCNGDVNRAINVLLEGSPDTVSPYVGYFPGIQTICAALLMELHRDCVWKHPAD